MTTYLKKILCVILCSFGFTFYAMAVDIPAEAQEVLEYWLGPLETAKTYPTDKARLWFSGGIEVDNEIRDRFEALVIAATQNELDDWKATPRSRLALIILIDQFTRNIYRGTPQAFAYDNIAQELALEGIAQEQDQVLYPIERVFFYLPLEHAENIEVQEISVQKFNTIFSGVPYEYFPHFSSFRHYAWRHYEIIAKFGRFPHRNAILGRESTPEETKFLKEPNSSF